MGKKNTVLKKTNKLGILSVECSTFLMIVLCVFPLVFRDYYYDILEFKCLFYIIAAIVFCAAIFITVILKGFRDWKRGERDRISALLKTTHPGNWKDLPLPVWLLTLFWAGCFFSTWLSDHRRAAITGSEGRYSGFLMISLYVITTLIIIRYAEIRRWLLDAFLGVSTFIALFGITDFFRMDILGFKSMEVGNPAADVFTSTIGNVNTYTAFLALSLGVAAVLFGIEHKGIRKVFYFAATLILYLGMMTGQSDNSYLSFAILFCTLPFFLFRSKNGIASYTLLAAGFLSCILFTGWIKTAYEDSVIDFWGVFDIIARIPGLKIFAALLWVVGVGLMIWSYRTSTEIVSESEERTFFLFRRAWAIVLVICLLVLAYIIYDANAGGNAERYGRLGYYIWYNDGWGSGRGYAWRIALEEYKKLPSWQRVFGSGPDTYGLLTEAHYQESIERYNVYYESAHNEYLQYYVTIGPATTFIYIAFLVASISEMIKKGLADSRIWGPCMAVMCYAIQAVVNISIPIAAAVMWAVLALGLAMGRDVIIDKQETVHALKGTTITCDDVILK